MPSDGSDPVSVFYSGDGGSPALGELMTGLARRGVPARLRNAGDTAGTAGTAGAGVILFDAFSEDLCARVRQCSGGGVNRLLAVASCGAAVGGGRAWRLLECGAADVFAWDAVPDPPATVAARVERWAAVEALVRSPAVRDNLVGTSRAWAAVLRQVVEVARFTDESVLLTGESGTGKELVARLIHTLDDRPGRRDLVVLDCTTVVPALSGSEFFGHERGAFTTAVAAREGAFALADGGTLFLDEVGELPPPLQAELLRVIQERTYKPVGSNAWRRADFRLVGATNRDLHRDRVTGAFRRDLYYRLASWTCRLPPLRERPEDILPLADHFLRTFRPDGRITGFDPAVQDYLRARNYPGNVRELRQLVLRIGNHHVGGGPITVGDIPAPDRPHAAEPTPGDWRNGDLRAALQVALSRGATLREIGVGASEVAIETALTEAGGCLQRAARRLGVTDRALQMRRAVARDRAGKTDGSNDTPDAGPKKRRRGAAPDDAPTLT